MEAQNSKKTVIWVYIKEHNLQDQSDKRQIVPDDKLAAVFGSPDSISMFKIAGALSQNLN